VDDVLDDTLVGVRRRAERALAVRAADSRGFLLAVGV
jgi:hypothetical protein